MKLKFSDILVGSAAAIACICALMMAGATVMLTMEGNLSGPMPEGSETFIGIVFGAMFVAAALMVAGIGIGMIFDE